MLPDAHEITDAFKIKASKSNSDYVAIFFICAQHNHYVKNGIFTKDLYIYAPGKSIHSHAKYIIMDYCDQEVKKFRRLISLPKGCW